ncbi:hypothetical protein Tco_1225291 [Tanacetum coccineum]
MLKVACLPSHPLEEAGREKKRPSTLSYRGGGACQSLEGFKTLPKECNDQKQGISKTMDNSGRGRVVSSVKWGHKSEDTMPSLANGKIEFYLELVHFVLFSIMSNGGTRAGHVTSLVILLGNKLRCLYFTRKNPGSKKAKASETTSGSAQGGLNLNDEVDGSGEEEEEKASQEAAELKRQELEIKRKTLELKLRNKWYKDLLFYNSRIDETLPPIQQEKLIEMKQFYGLDY